MKITTSAGHSYACDGAQGCGYSEHNEAVWANNYFIELCQANGVAVSNCTSEAGSVNAYLREQCNLANASGADLAIQWHFNAGGGTGTECLYLTEKSLAADVSAAIATAGGYVDRGAKYRSDLYWLNNTRMPAILIEVCFIDNCSDMAKWQAYWKKIVEAVFYAVTGEGDIVTDDDIRRIGEYVWVGYHAQGQDTPFNQIFKLLPERIAAKVWTGWKAAGNTQTPFDQLYYNSPKQVIKRVDEVEAKVDKILALLEKK